MVSIGGFGTGWLLGWFPSTPFTDGSTLSSLQDVIAPYLYEPRRIAFAFAHFSWIALALRSPAFGWLTGRLIACGRMALSLYISQTLAYGILFYGFGFSLFGALEHVHVTIIAIVLTLAQLLAAPVYLSFFRQGPLEWLLRRLAWAKTSMPAKPAVARANLRQPAE